MAIISDCKTIPELLSRRVEADGGDVLTRRRDKPAIWIKNQGRIEAWTWSRLKSAVERVARMLIGLGVEAGDRVALLSENRLEWVLCDLGIQAVGAINVPIHASLTSEQVVWQIEDSGAKVVFVSGFEQRNKLKLSNYVKVAIVSFEPLVHTNWFPRDDFFDASPPELISDMLARRSVGASSIATILYTSGTTGEPKGVMLTQGNLMSNAVSTVEAFRADEEPQRTDYSDQLRLNFLPLSHIFARTCDLYIWLVEGSQLAIAESRESVLTDAAAVKPTFINGVPYFYDKLCRGLTEKGLDKQPGALKAVLGGRIEHCCSGGAALPDHVFDFFQAQGVPLLQGYGLSESSPVISISTASHVRRGSSGRPIPGVEVKIEADGEILSRGPHIMAGYYKNPEATDAVLKDGWLYTGDYGRLDEDGYLFITGRKKEILVTAGGKNIAPVYLESLLTQDPLILQAMVIGDSRNYLTALIVPNLDALKTELATHKVNAADNETLLKHPQALSLIQERVNSRLACVSSFEQVRKVTLLPRGFSIESGELTAKLSLRRKVIEANFAAEIEAMYRREASERH